MSNDDDATPPIACPPLRIHHLLVATAACAAALVIVPLPNDWDPAIESLANLLGGGLGVCFIGYATAWAYQGRFCRSPGQGFLVLFAVRLTTFALARWVEQWGDAPSQSLLLGVYPSYAMLLNRIEVLVQACAAVVGLLLFANSARWRVAYAVFAVIPLALVVEFIGWDLLGYQNIVNRPIDWLFYFADRLQHAAFPGTLITVAWAALVDRRRGVRHDWTHWLGIVVLMVAYLQPSYRALLRVMGHIA